MKKNSIIKISFLSFLVVFVVPIFFTFIHEMSHIIVSLTFGNPLTEIIFTNVLEKNFFTFGVGLVFDRINKDAILWVAISGSIGSIIISVPFIILGIKKRSLLCAFIGNIIVIKEFMYWTFGSYYNLGDPYNLFWSLENQFDIVVNTYNFFLFFLIATIMMYGLYTLVLNKVWRLKEIDKYGK